MPHDQSNYSLGNLIHLHNSWSWFLHGGRGHILMVWNVNDLKLLQKCPLVSNFDYLFFAQKKLETYFASLKPHHNKLKMWNKINTNLIKVSQHGVNTHLFDESITYDSQLQENIASTTCSFCETILHTIHFKNQNIFLQNQQSYLLPHHDNSSNKQNQNNATQQLYRDDMLLQLLIGHSRMGSHNLPDCVLQISFDAATFFSDRSLDESSFSNIFSHFMPSIYFYYHLILKVSL